jgi:hypothetical protein
MTKNSLDLLVEIICEIFDGNPNAGFKLGLTNGCFYEVLKDKINNHFIIEETVCQYNF